MLVNTSRGRNPSCNAKWLGNKSQLTRQFHKQRWAGYFLVVGGISMIFAGIWFVVNAVTFLNSTSRTDGTVVALERKSNAKGFDTYHPVVRFIPPETETTVEFKSRFGVWPSPFAISDRVEVAYDPVTDRRPRINSFWTIWFLPMLLFAFGLACGFAGYHTLQNIRNADKPRP